MNKIAFVFPGQGAQKTGMGQDFYENSEIAHEIFDRASVVTGLDMKHLCFEENEMLDLTEYTQAALVTTCLAMARCLEYRGVKPDVTAGLSLGEYCAIAMAGGINDEDAIRLVRKRGSYMEHAVPEGEGAMAAILGMESDKISELIQEKKHVYVANYNCPGQTVITGAKEGVLEAADLLKENGAKKVVALNVSGPFHSPLLAEAKKQMEEELQKVLFKDLKIPYVTNVTAEYISDIGRTRELLADQVCASVRWQQSVERMIEDGVDTFVEIGPGRTLTGFIRKIDKNVKTINVSKWEDLDVAVKELTGESDNE